MKKAFDQTVWDLKREVNKKVLKVPGIEQKILDATSNEPWGPHGSHLADIAQATLNHPEYEMIMHVIWKRLNDTGKNWRHVYKALTVLEYLVGHGTERVIDEIREHAYQISTLSDFQFIDSSGRDQGSNVQRKSQSLVALVNDKERIQEVRQQAIANRDKFCSTHSLGGRSLYGDRYEEDRYEGRYRDSYDGRSRDSYEGRYRDSYESRYRDEDRSGSGRDRDWHSRDDERYGRGNDSYNRDGDRFGRDLDEHYRRDNYRDNDYRGRCNGDYQFGPRSRSLDRDRDRYSEEDDRSSRNNGGRVDEPSQDDRRLERKLSGQSPPPTYEAAVKDAHEQVQDGRGAENVASSATEAFSPPAAKSSIPTSISQEPNQYTNSASPSANNEGDEFDEFDPRGSMPDDDLDFWGEDEEPNNVTDDALRHSSALNREWKWRHEQFHTMGYRDGITAGKEVSAQEGFNVGFKQSIHSGYKWGLVRGISSAYARLPDHLKDKLVGTAEKREKLQNLYQSGQMISTTDALKMFHESIQRTEARKETSESSSHLLTHSRESSYCSQLDSLSKELHSLLIDLPEIVLEIDPRKENVG